jgi:hypothetical protein
MVPNGGWSTKSEVTTFRPMKTDKLVRNGSLLVLTLLACTATVKQQSIDKVLGAMSSEQRRDNFQEMATVLDEHPDWVDQFYEVARRHPPLMKRFLTRAAHDLKDPGLAKTTGELLSDEPASLEQVLVSTVDAAKTKKEARLAIDRAVAARAEPMADVLTDSPATIEAITKGFLTVAAKKPAAKEALQRAVEGQSARIVEFAASDPGLLSSMSRSLLVAAAKDKESLLKLLKELHVL